MSILIKGMEMPKHCWQCKFHDDMDTCIIIGENCVEVWGEYRRLNSCPLIPVPSHGRLIDADALMKMCGMTTDCNDCPNGYRGWCKLSQDAVNICEAIEDAPTIIPADKEGEG